MTVETQDYSRQKSIRDAFHSRDLIDTTRPPIKIYYDYCYSQVLLFNRHTSPAKIIAIFNRAINSLKDLARSPVYRQDIQYYCFAAEVKRRKLRVKYPHDLTLPDYYCSANQLSNFLQSIVNENLDVVPVILHWDNWYWTVKPQYDPTKGL
jgi:hypothetical protein